MCGRTESDCGGQQLAPYWRSWLGDALPQTPAGRQEEKLDRILKSHFTATSVALALYLDEQGLVGGLHGLLGSVEMRLELSSLDSGLIELNTELLQLHMEVTVLGLDLLVHNPALLQLGFTLKEMGLTLV